MWRRPHDFAAGASDPSGFSRRGLKIAEERDTQSGVPILSDIPLVSFFFSRKGQYKRYKNLLILLKANVVLMDEHEPGLGVRR